MITLYKYIQSHLTLLKAGIWTTKMSPFYITVRIYSSSFIVSFLSLARNALSCFVCSNLENKSPGMPSELSSLLGKRKKRHSLLRHAHPAPWKAPQSSPCAHTLGPLTICTLVGALEETAMEGGQVSAREKGIHQVGWQCRSWDNLHSHHWLSSVKLYGS